MKLDEKDKEVLKSMPKDEASKLMDEWVKDSHLYTKNNRDWSPLEIMSKHFGEKDLEIKSKLLKKAYDLYQE